MVDDTQFNSEITLSLAEVRFIQNILREGTIKWQGRSGCLRAARKRVKIGVYKNGNPQYKFYWQCAKCKRWDKNEKAMEVDHIIEIGPFNGCWNSYISKVFCPQANLQCLCHSCHLRKTGQYNSAATRWRRKSQIA